MATLTLPYHLMLPTAPIVPVDVVAKLTVVLVEATTSKSPSYVVVPSMVMVLPTGYGLGTALPALVKVNVAMPVETFAVPLETFAA